MLNISRNSVCRRFGTSSRSAGVLLTTIMSLALCFFSFESLAGYRVDYAIDMQQRGAESGAAECPCVLEFKELRISVSLISVLPPGKGFSVTIDGWDALCCYFTDGNNAITVDFTKKINKLKVFEGRKRRGNEVVRNIHVGTLILVFKDID